MWRVPVRSGYHFQLLYAHIGLVLSFSHRTAPYRTQTSPVRRGRAHPCFITCDREDNVVVSDSGNSAIKLFKQDGQLIRTFSLSEFRLQDDFVLLLRIQVDTSGHILLIGNSVIYIRAANGRVWEVVLPEDGLHSPKKLAVCESGKLVVTQCGYDNRHGVSVFAYDSNDFRSLRIGR